MGGYGSGRHGGRPTVEQCKTISVGQITGRRGKGTDRAGWSGSINWRHVHTGELTTQLRFSTVVVGESGWTDLDHEAARVGQAPRRVSYRVHLEAMRQPFGGLRWFFLCPSTHQLVRKLYLPLGGVVFASRQAYRLAYRSQRDTVHDRAINQAWKARIALGGKPGEHPLGSYIPRRKWKHNRTYVRDVAALKAKEAVTDWHLLQTLAKWGNPWALERLAEFAQARSR